MRTRASIIGQLLVVFAVCAGLIGIAAAFGYAAVTRQDATAKQLTVQDYLLQHEAGLLQVEFDVAQGAVNGYALSGHKSDLLPLRSQEAGYESNVDALRVTAAKSLQGYVTEQVAGRGAAVRDSQAGLPAAPEVRRGPGAGRWPARRRGPVLRGELPVPGACG